MVLLGVEELVLFRRGSWESSRSSRQDLWRKKRGLIGSRILRTDGARALAAKVDAVDPELLEGGVGGGVLRGEGGREGGDAEGLHLGCVVGGRLWG